MQPSVSEKVPKGPQTSSSMAPRTILKPTALDTIVQSSTVEILRSYEVSVAPRSRSEVSGFATDSDVVGVIGYEGPGVRGNLTLAVPVNILPAPRLPPKTSHEEWMYELTSQVMGRIKNRLIQFQLKLRTQTPSVVSGMALERYKRRTGREVLYRFMALRGEIAVTIDTSLAQATLEYSNAPLVLGDEEAVLFD
jgi:hypothetical protein